MTLRGLEYQWSSEVRTRKYLADQCMYAKLYCAPSLIATGSQERRSLALGRLRPGEPLNTDKIRLVNASSLGVGLFNCLAAAISYIHSQRRD